MASKTTGTATIANRYATALFELADDEKALDPVAEDMRRLKVMVDESDDLRRLVLSPVISRDDQGKAMSALLDKAEVSDLTKKFVGLVALNRRLFALRAMIEAYLAELARRRGEVSADVTSAAALSEGQVASVTEAIKQAVGGKVAVSTHVDPSLLGGLVVRVGSRMVDSSLKTKLQKLELAMKGAG